jgi:hypothetical protein
LDHQLDLVINSDGSGKNIISNGPRPVDETAEEGIDGDFVGTGEEEDWGLLDSKDPGQDPFADEGSGDY